MIGNTMTKIFLCYGIILGLYCLVHEVYSTEDGRTSQHYNAKHKREREDENFESGKLKDQIFLKSGSPIQGRKIHQTAWSKEVTENSLEDLKVADRTLSLGNTGSWNFMKLLNYLLSLLNETERPEQVKMTSSEKVEIIKNKIKAKIRERNKPSGNDKKGSENLEAEKETYRTGLRTSYLEDSYEESGESYAEESCEESEDSSSSENNGSVVEDCYEDEESEEKSFPNKVIGRTEISFKNKIAKGVQSESQNTHENNKIPGQEVIILNGTVVKEEKQQVRNNLPDTTSTESTTEFQGISTESQNTKLNKDEVKPGTNTIVTQSTGSYIDEPTAINLIATKNDHKESEDQFIPINTENLAFNIGTESKAFLDEKSLVAADTILETHVTNSNTATETLHQDINKVIVSTAELPLIIKESQTTEIPLNIEVKPTMDEMINVSPTVTHNIQNEAQKFENLNTDKNSIPSPRILQNQEERKTFSEMSFDTSKTSMGDQDQTMMFTQEKSEKIDDNRLQEESFLSYGREDEILQEFNLGNEFIELSNIHEDKFQNLLQGYKMDNPNSEDESQQYSVIPQNVPLNEDQETFDTILEFLYKHSNNPLILSLRNSSKTLF